MRQALIVIAAVVIAAQLLPGVAQGADLAEGMAYKVQGIARDGALVVTIQVADPSPIVGLRVYSEPSHTLLATMIDSAFKASAEGEGFLSEVSAGTMETRMAGGAGRIQIPDVRPQTDDRISVWVRLADGAYTNTSDARVPREDFGISSSLPER